jgi:hypothetical protein
VSASTPASTPVTGKQSYLRATISGTDDAAWRKAENQLAEFRAQVLRQRSHIGLACCDHRDSSR